MAAYSKFAFRLSWLAVPLALGCQTTTQPIIQADDGPESQAVAQGSESKKRAADLATIKKPQVPLEELERALVDLATLPPSEGPKFWTNILASTRYNDDHRRVCFVAFFRRYVLPGMRLNRICEITGESDWFNANNLQNVTIAEVLPITNRGACAYVYRPEVFDSRSGVYRPSGGICFSLARYVSKEQLVQILNGLRDDGGNSIVEIKSSPGDTLADLVGSGGPGKRGNVPDTSRQFRKYQ